MGRTHMATWIKRGAAALLLVVLLAALAAWWLVRGSLPALEGQLDLAGLSAPVTVQRDALGVVTIDAANERDAIRALGYVHAQERYFEMDLMRRTAAGELAELFGPRAVATDKRHRVHRMRARVTRNLDAIAGDRLPVLQAYTDGINAGLTHLKVRPWPYLLLRTRPEPWQLADTPLVGYAMYFDLQDSTNARELALWRIKPHLPPALFKLLRHDGSSWDAPMAGASRGDAVLPGAAQLDLRKLPTAPARVATRLSVPKEPGSNNFAVAASLTRDGRAIVANDMHLTLRAPNIWFRVQLRYHDPRAPRGRVELGGFTLPGLPLVVVGSNGHIAWGFTNGYGDWLDWQLQPGCIPGAAPNGNTVRCPGFITTTERIDVAGAAPTFLAVEETTWGPIIHRNPDGSALALRWIAHLPRSLSLGLGDFAWVSSLDAAVEAADRVAIPEQNLLLADRHGRIAWRLLGPLPDRTGSCSTHDLVENAPDDAPATEPCHPWSLLSQGAPRLVDPPSGRAWTANNRVVDGVALQRIGDGGYALGARGKQIRDALFARQQFDERELLAIQLDDRTLFMHRWWLLLRDSAARSKSPALRELADAGATWQARATADSVSYRLTRAWRLKVHERVADGLTAPARATMGEAFAMPELPQLEGVVWPLLTQRPLHLLPLQYANWDALLEAAAGDVRDELKAKGPLAERTWGERNIANICHPLAGALPTFAKGALCMPFEPLPGDTAMPRVQGPDFGASQRMVVSPGHEADGIVQMPGGQSGHPLSPYWGAGHDDWVHGRPTPFLPCKPRRTMQLMPEP